MKQNIITWLIFGALMCCIGTLMSCKEEKTEKGLNYSSGTTISSAVNEIDKIVSKSEAEHIIEHNGLDNMGESESWAYSKANFLMLMEFKRDFESFKSRVELDRPILTQADSLEIMVTKAKSDGYILTKKK
jgi:hypothetical protein